MPKVGFIGSGNMGSALCRAAAYANDTRIYVADAIEEKARALANSVNGLCATNGDIYRECDLIFFAVKPNVLPEVLKGASEVLRSRGDGFTLVSMAAGVAISKIEEALGFPCPVIRIMPNTPASVGEGMILWCANAEASAEQRSAFLNCLEHAGKLCEIPERLIDAGSAVSGCGPAFVYMFIEALADGAVECGLPRDLALLFAKQTVIGSGTLALESQKHPGALKDEVCSPGGSTIAGVHALESSAFRAAVMDAVKASFEKTKELGK